MKAVGYKKGKAVAEHVVHTPDEACNLKIDYFESGKPASNHDLLIVYVRLEDENGTVCFGENTREVSLEVLDGGWISGPSRIKAEAGVASFLVETDMCRSLVLRAFSEGLSADHKIRLEKY